MQQRRATGRAAGHGESLWHSGDFKGEQSGIRGTVSRHKALCNSLEHLTVAVKGWIRSLNPVL